MLHQWLFTSCYKYYVHKPNIEKLCWAASHRTNLQLLPLFVVIVRSQDNRLKAQPCVNGHHSNPCFSVNVWTAGIVVTIDNEPIISTSPSLRVRIPRSANNKIRYTTNYNILHVRYTTKYARCTTKYARFTIKHKARYTTNYNNTL